MKSILLGITCIALTGCVSSGLDKQIAVLHQQIGTARAALSQNAKSYYAIKGEDFQLDVTGRPLLDMVAEYNKLPAAQHLMTIRSVDRNGVIAEFSRSCGWLGGSWGAYAEVAFDQALFATAYVDRIDAQWSATNGLAFRLQRGAVAGAVIVDGGVRICFLGSYPIVPGAAVIVGGANTAGGATELTPVADGVQYRIFIDHSYPIYLFIDIQIAYFNLPLVAPYSFDISKETIHNILGQKGKVQIGPNGEVRNFDLNYLFDKAGFEQNGLYVAGKIGVNWPLAERPTAFEMHKHSLPRSTDPDGDAQRGRSAPVNSRISPERGPGTSKSRFSSLPNLRNGYHNTTADDNVTRQSF